MNIILLLSSLLVAVSGCFLISGYMAYQKSLLILENLSHLIFKINQEWEKERKEFKHEGTDAD